MNRTEIEVKDFLEKLGFNVMPIAEVADQRRADLRISDSRHIEIAIEIFALQTIWKGNFAPNC